MLSGEVVIVVQSLALDDLHGLSATADLPCTVRAIITQ